MTNISPTEETAKAIDERAAMGAIGDMRAYLQFKTARAVEEAATATGEGGAGTFAQMGAGLGAGVGMGAMMAGVMGQAMQGGAAAAAPMIACPSCGNPMPANAKFCPNCGAKIGEGMICANCKADIPPGSKFCPNCGTQVE